MKCSFFSLVAALLMLGGCANDPVPAEQMRVSQQALEQAQGLGTDEQLPSFKAASDKLALADAALAAGDNKRARVLAEQAELDVRLAEAQWVNSKQQAHIKMVQARVEGLRKQLEASQ